MAKKQPGPGAPQKEDAKYMLEVRQRHAKSPPGTRYWTIALDLGHELDKQGKLGIKPESFARRISDKLKRADGILPKSPHRADYALSNLRSSLMKAWYWLEEYQRATGRKLTAPDELSPWIRQAMELTADLLSSLESRD